MRMEHGWVCPPEKGTGVRSLHFSTTEPVAKRSAEPSRAPYPPVEPFNIFPPELLKDFVWYL